MLAGEGERLRHVEPVVVAVPDRHVKDLELGRTELLHRDAVEFVHVGERRRIDRDDHHLLVERVRVLDLRA